MCINFARDQARRSSAVTSSRRQRFKEPFVLVTGNVYTGKYRPPKIQIVLMKCDLVKRVDLARRVAIVRQQLDEVRLYVSIRRAL